MNSALVFGLALAVAAPAIKDRPPKPSAVVGEWELYSLIVDGTEEPPQSPPIRYKFKADGTWVICCGSHELGGLHRGYEVNEKTTPPRIDLVTDTRVKDSIRTEGIFMVEGDTLTVCTAGATTKRPTRFESTADKRANLYVFKRVKT